MLKILPAHHLDDGEGDDDCGEEEEDIKTALLRTTRIRRKVLEEWEVLPQFTGSEHLTS